MEFPSKPSGSMVPLHLVHSVADRFRAAPPAGQFVLLAIAGAGLLAVALCGLVGVMSPVPLAIGAGTYVAGALLATHGLRRDYPHSVVGWCNAVTLFRMTVVSLLIAALAAPAVDIWVIVGLATVAFALDGLDGWLARREGYASRFGARFDVEVDSVLALVLAIHVYLSGTVGAYVILFGLPRYAFAVAQMALPWLNGDLPERFSRKVVCVLQIAVLIAVLSPLIQSPFADGLLIGIATALIWSFWLDIRLLWRTRR